jgi:hypothetical protein
MSEGTGQEYDLNELETMEDPAAPVIFVDGFWGLAIADGVARINLYRLKYPYGQAKPHKVIVATLAISAPSLWKVTQTLEQLRVDLVGRNV